MDHQTLVADNLSEDSPLAKGESWLDRLRGLVTLIEGKDVAHLLITDGWRRLRIDLYGYNSAGAPNLPRWQLSGIDLNSQLLSLRRLVSVARSQRFGGHLWPRDPRTRRWILALRAHDAIAAGAGHRELAELFGGVTGDARWRSREPSLRLQAQRLAALTRTLQGMGFADRYLASAEVDRGH
ncbi:MAG: DUF2285 domain-containing protein [Sphingomonas sp.]|uniref:DNA -binding domain-containing protein n=1 Tax=Sphingomonas sp. TaxID=28214 RepID=UPI0025EB847D|nr:DUF2285 domain-containing protein [Sphingomonas sp.]MBX3563602.1 DUF2285 domain-containing protein [Sphingomonas sp.]